MDHLMGKVFIEYLSPLKRNRIKTKLVKQLKDEERDSKDSRASFSR
jgi:peptide deformylase